MFFSNPNCRSETPHNLSLLESIELYSFWDAVDPENWDIKNIETFLLKRFDVFLRRDIREKGKASKPTHHDSPGVFGVSDYATWENAAILGALLIGIHYYRK